MSMLKRIIDKSRNEGESVQSAIKSKNNLIEFSFDGKLYYLGIRESILVFDENMNLLYTFEPNEIALSDNEFIKKVNEIVNSNSNDLVHLYINKVGSVEHITFTSLFDATFIFKKFKRLMSRDSEGITSLIIEKNSKTIHSASNERLAFKEKISESYVGDIENREARDDEKTQYIATLARVEDLLEDVISKNISELGIQKNPVQIKKMVELLQSLVAEDNDGEAYYDGFDD